MKVKDKVLKTINVKYHKKIKDLTTSVIKTRGRPSLKSKHKNILPKTYLTKSCVTKARRSRNVLKVDTRLKIKIKQNVIKLKTFPNVGKTRNSVKSLTTSKIKRIKKIVKKNTHSKIDKAGIAVKTLALRKVKKTKKGTRNALSKVRKTQKDLKENLESKLRRNRNAKKDNTLSRVKRTRNAMKKSAHSRISKTRKKLKMIKFLVNNLKSVKSSKIVFGESEDVYQKIQSSKFPRVVLKKLVPQKIQIPKFPRVVLKKLTAATIQDYENARAAVIETQDGIQKDILNTRDGTREIPNEITDVPNNAEEIMEIGAFKTIGPVQEIPKTTDRIQKITCILKPSDGVHSTKLMIIEGVQKQANVIQETRAKSSIGMRTRSRLSVGDVPWEKNDTQKSYKCPQCDYATDNKQIFNKHKRTHTASKTREETPALECPECLFDSRSREEMELHMSVHKVLECSECDYQCKTKVQLYKHRKVHAVKHFECWHCGHKTNRRDKFDLHLLRHSKIKLFRCSKCSYACNQRVQLKTHMFSHLDRKRFACAECDFKTNYRKTLNNHILKEHISSLFGSLDEFEEDDPDDFDDDDTKLLLQN